jgi:hypothetical protein
VALINDPQNRLWRTGTRADNAQEIFALFHNDVTKPTRSDPLIGVMETSALAEIVVETHNLVVQKFGRHYLRALKADE